MGSAGQGFVRRICVSSCKNSTMEIVLFTMIFYVSIIDLLSNYMQYFRLFALEIAEAIIVVTEVWKF